MMMMSVVVMVMMSVRAFFVMNVAVLLVAILAFGFKLEGYVVNTMFFQFLTNFVLYFVGICCAYNMHRGIIALSVH